MQQRDHRNKWQTVMLILTSGQRLNCHACGGLAIFAIVDEKEDFAGEYRANLQGWCQDCWQQAQEEMIAEEEDRE